MAALRDLLRYGAAGSFGTEKGAWDNPMNLVNNTDMSDEQFYAQHLTGTGSNLTRDNGQWGIKAGSVLDGLGSISQGRDNEGNTLSALNIDYSMLPKTKFGDASKVSAVQDSSKLINPDMVYDDPNYGKITHSANMRSGNEMYFPILMSLLTMGAGSIGAFGPLGSQMMSLVKGGQKLGQGGSPLGSLGSLAGLFKLGG